MAFDPKMTLGFVDVETTGLNAEGNGSDGGREPDHITEIAVARVHPETMRIEESVHVYVWPKRPVSDEVRRINGYSEEIWADRGAMGIRQALARTLPLLGGTVPTGQNPHFDVDRFLRKAWENAGRMGADRIVPDIVPWPEMDYHRIDIASLALPLKVAGHIPGLSLKYTRKLFGLMGEQSHTAMGDVRDEIHVYGCLMRLYGNAAMMVHERMLDWASHDRRLPGEPSAR